MLHMALSQTRSLETFALPAPLFLAGLAIVLLAGTVAYASVVRSSPIPAVRRSRRWRS
jgi:hypothetical protein